MFNPDIPQDMSDQGVPAQGEVRVGLVEERIEKDARDPHGNADCWCRSASRPHYRGTGNCIMAPPEHTGVSDVQADLDTLRGLLTGYLREDALGRHAHDVGFEALQRIEQWVGERG